MAEIHELESALFHVSSTRHEQVRGIAVRAHIRSPCRAFRLDAALGGPCTSLLTVHHWVDSGRDKLCLGMHLTVASTAPQQCVVVRPHLDQGGTSSSGLCAKPSPRLHPLHSSLSTRLMLKKHNFMTHCSGMHVTEQTNSPSQHVPVLGELSCP